MKKRFISALLLTVVIASVLSLGAFADASSVTVNQRIDTLTVNSDGTVNVILRDLTAGKDYVFLLVGYDDNNKMLECKSATITNAGQTSSEKDQFTISNLTADGITKRKIFLISTSDGIAPYVMPYDWNGSNIANGDVELPHIKI